MEESENQLKYYRKIMWTIIVIVSIIASYKSYEYYNEIQNNGVYVLAEITKPGVRKVEFVFNFKGELYTGTNSKVDRSQYKGEIVYLKILPYRPYQNRLELNIKVPQCLVESPFDGWKIIPIDTCKK